MLNIVHSFQRRKLIIIKANLYRSGHSQTYYIAKSDLESQASCLYFLGAMIYLIYIQAPLHPAYAVLGIEPRPSCILGHALLTVLHTQP